MKELLDPIVENLPMIISMVLSILIASIVLIRVTVVYGERWKRNAKKYGGTRRYWPPRKWGTLFAIQPKKLHRLQNEILKNEKIREFYAPAASYIEEKKEKGLYVPDTLLSPFSQAVKASMKDNKVARRGKHMYAARQIKEAARHVSIRPLPEDVFIGGDRSQHFIVDLHRQKRPRAEIAPLMPYAAGAFDSDDFEEHNADNLDEKDRISVLVHMVPPEDILIERKFGVEFFKENPAKTPYSLPLAVQENGKPWCLSLHHTLIYGMTGAGKGGPIQGAIRQLTPFVHEGIVKLYGIDPKGPELGAYAKKGVKMFERISIGLAEENIRQHVKTINQIASIIASRGNNIEPDFTEGAENLNRDIPATKKTPWIVVFIDEYLTLVKGLKKLGKEGAPALATLDQILATGRSFGVYVILATQVATKEVFGDVRDNIPTTVVLKHKAGNYWTQEFLGEEIPGTRLDPKKIGPSNKDNGYKTAGIASVSTTEGVIRVRFGYLSDKDIVEIAKQFMDEDADLSVFDEPIPEFDPKDYGLELTQEEANALDGIFDDEDQGGFGFEKVSNPDDDDFSLALDNFKD